LASEDGNHVSTPDRLTMQEFMQQKKGKNTAQKVCLSLDKKMPHKFSAPICSLRKKGISPHVLLIHGA
jgi:hypothetical protein